MMRGDETIELYVKVQVPLADLAERHPGLRHSWGDKDPDAWAIAKAEQKAIQDGERTLQDFVDLAKGARAKQMDAFKKGEHIYPRPEAKVTYRVAAGYYYVWEDVQRTVERIAPYLSSESVRLIRDSVMECLGYDRDEERLAPVKDAPRGPDAKIINALRKLAKFAPEHYSGDFARLVAENDSTYTDAEDASNFLNDLYAWDAEKQGKPTHEEVPRPSDPTRTIRRRIVKDERCPFFSEAVLYPVLGKDDARTLLALLRQAKETVGIDRNGD